MMNFGFARGGRAIALLLLGLFCVRGAGAVQLAGVTLPDTREVGGVRLVLNGVGVRTVPILGIRVYVAGLYLEQRSSDAAAIVRSLDTKLLEIHFLHDVPEARAREAWQTGFTNNCETPCRLTSEDIARFLAAEPEIHRGDVSMFLFTRNGMTVTFNGRTLGSTDNVYFAQQVLNTFLGPVPATPSVKRGLLGEE